LVVHGFYDIRDDDADKIKLHCPNLKSVCLQGLSISDSPSITRLLASYGDRLEYALICYLNDDQIRAVSDACPNACFHLTGDGEFGISLSSLSLIGPRLEGVTLFLTESVGIGGDLVEWTKAWSQCVNLRHLEFTPLEFDDHRAVFSTPKNDLISISVHQDESTERDEWKKVMFNLENGTKIVEKFICRGLPYFIDELDGFIGKNRTTLRYIELGGTTFTARNWKLDELLQSFLQLPALEELYVDYVIPQDILSSLRNNGVYACRPFYL